MLSNEEKFALIAVALETAEQAIDHSGEMLRKALPHLDRLASLDEDAEAEIDELTKLIRAYLGPAT